MFLGNLMYLPWQSHVLAKLKRSDTKCCFCILYNSSSVLKLEVFCTFHRFYHAWHLKGCLTVHCIICIPLFMFIVQLQFVHYYKKKTSNLFLLTYATHVIMLCFSVLTVVLFRLGRRDSAMILRHSLRCWNVVSTRRLSSHYFGTCLQLNVQLEYCISHVLTTCVLAESYMSVSVKYLFLLLLQYWFYGKSISIDIAANILLLIGINIHSWRNYTLAGEW